VLIAQLLEYALGHTAARPAQAVQQQRMLLVGRLPDDFIPQPVQGNVDHPRQMPFPKLGLSAHINDQRPFAQPRTRRCRLNLGQVFEQQEGGDNARNDDPSGEGHTDRLARG